MNGFGRKKRYTLVEMLVVIAVMALLLTVATPAFNRIAKGNSLSIATRTLGGKINACRAYAVEKRCHVALLFLQMGDEVPDVYFNNSYRPCMVVNNNGNFSFLSWIEGEEWQSFPDGVIIPEANSNFEIDSGTLHSVSDVPVGSIQDTPVDDMNKKITLERAILFQPDGQIYSSGKEHIIRITEGRYDSDSGEFIATNLNDGKVIYRTLTVSPFTGRVLYGTSSPENKWN